MVMSDGVIPNIDNPKPKMADQLRGLSTIVRNNKLGDMRSISEHVYNRIIKECKVKAKLGIFFANLNMPYSNDQLDMDYLRKKLTEDGFKFEFDHSTTTLEITVQWDYPKE